MWSSELCRIEHIISGHLHSNRGVCVYSVLCMHMLHRDIHPRTANAAVNSDLQPSVTNTPRCLPSKSVSQWLTALPRADLSLSSIRPSSLSHTRSTTHHYCGSTVSISTQGHTTPGRRSSSVWRSWELLTYESHQNRWSTILYMPHIVCHYNPVMSLVDCV